MTTITLTLGWWMLPPAALSVGALLLGYVGAQNREDRASAWVVVVMLWLCVIYGRISA